MESMPSPKVGFWSSHVSAFSRTSTPVTMAVCHLQDAELQAAAVWDVIIALTWPTHKQAQKWKDTHTHITNTRAHIGSVKGMPSVMHYALCRMLCRLHRPGRIHPLREARCISIDVSHPRIICIRISLRSPCIKHAHTWNTHTQR